MPYRIDETHDPKLESWIESANDPNTDFPIQNLPLCRFAPPHEHGLCDHLGVRIGDTILDLQELAYTLPIVGDTPGPAEADMFAGENEPSLLSSFNGPLGHAIRARLQHVLAATNRGKFESIVRENLHAVEDCEFDPPAVSRDYTDFYASLFHATNVGSMFRPDNPILPNYKHIPIGYHGRASSIVPSGTPIIRPLGQKAPPDDPSSTGSSAGPSFGPCSMLDYELEVGAVIARGNELGNTIPLAEAEDHILGLCLVNDWSARDLQKWEYQPLGPFLAKNFATTISPYIVTMEALAPFRCPAFTRDPADPRPLPYLSNENNERAGGFDITLEVYLASEQMRTRGMSPIRLSRGGFKDMYWTLAQMLTHHASNGCNMQPGDLIASGTVSGRTRDARGCMLELTWNGDPFANPPVKAPGTSRTPIELPTGEKRVFLADGDEVIIRGYCEREGFRRIGFGECRGIIQPARA
ncbi:MAG: fumarylacetoacetase [Phycisphaerales bacterium]|jgi:fumarylacetoacetase|nr:fumarylacetoacetase [Phycisphaerales bacterium]